MFSHKNNILALLFYVYLCYLKSKNNAKFLLLVHLIFVVKYRKKLLSIYGTEVKNKIIEIAGRNNFEIDTIEVDTDHIHLLVPYEPKVYIYIANSKIIKK